MTDPSRRAHEAWQALCRACTVRRGDELVLAEPPLRRSNAAAVWPLSQALAAAMDVAELDGGVGDVHVEGLLSRLERHRRGDAYAAFPHERLRYFDDNAWLGLALVQWHTQRGDPRHLRAARRLLDFLESGVHESGGVHWREGRRQPRNTCATAPAMQLALRLHETDTDPALVGFARRCDEFLATHLESPDGLLWDHLDHSGAVERTVWSYNQGTVVAARVLLAATTGDEAVLDSAAATAEATLAYFGADDRWWRQPAVFNAVCMRNLVAAAALWPGLDPEHRIRRTVNEYLDRAWREARDPHTGLFVHGGIGRYDDGCIDQAGLTQLFALVAWPPARLTIVT